MCLQDVRTDYGGCIMRAEFADLRPSGPSALVDCQLELQGLAQRQSAVRANVKHKVRSWLARRSVNIYVARFRASRGA